MIKRVAILIVAIIAVVVGRHFFFYSGSYTVPAIQTPSYEHITVSESQANRFTESGREGTGTLLVDRGHGNQFTADELSVLIERVLSRGYAVEYLDLSEKAAQKEKETALRARLSVADAFAVVLPQSKYGLEEIAIVSDFVDKGGKVILVADPTRSSFINSLANQFGITFQADYLYNQKENDGNFRNIFIKEFKESDLTRGLQRVVLYSASSISPSDWGLAFADADTVSNLVESAERFSTMLVSQNSRVLAISDLTLMGEPYSSAYDNNHLVANIADWLTLSERKFLLTDFPYFFSSKVKIEADTKLLDFGVKVRSLLEGYRKTAEMGKLGGMDGEQVFIGLFSHADNVSAQLQAGGIVITTDKEISIEIKGIGQVYRAETALLYLSSEEKSRTLIILADVESGLQRLIDGLTKGDFRQWLARDDLALSYLKKAETPTPTPTPRPVEKPTPKP